MCNEHAKPILTQKRQRKQANIMIVICEFTRTALSVFVYAIAIAKTVWKSNVAQVNCRCRRRYWLV